MNDLDIPWKRYRREKIAREDLPPTPSAAREQSSYRWSGGCPADNIVPFPPPPETTLEEDAKDLPL